MQACSNAFPVCYFGPNTVSPSLPLADPARVHAVLYITTDCHRNDPRLMQETPEILAISNMLERPVGQYISYGLFCIGPAISTILAAAKQSHAAVVVATGAFIFLIVVGNLIILKCGTSLLHTINQSLRRNSGHTQTIVSSTSAAAEAGQDENREKSAAAARKKQNPNILVVARKKITMALSICIVLALQTIFLLLFAVFSAYGKAAPLLFLAVPM